VPRPFGVVDEDAGAVLFDDARDVRQVRDFTLGAEDAVGNDECTLVGSQLGERAVE